MGEPVLLWVETLKLHLDRDILEGDEAEHSFRSTQYDEGKGGVTVTLESGFTRLRYGDETYTFQGVRYFPAWESEYLHQDVLEADVDLDAPEWVYEDEYPRWLADLDVAGFVKALENGTIKPAPVEQD